MLKLLSFARVESSNVYRGYEAEGFQSRAFLYI